MAKPAAKAKKDSKPKSKKPLKGFMLFSKEMRPKVKAEVSRRRPRRGAFNRDAAVTPSRSGTDAH